MPSTSKNPKYNFLVVDDDPDLASIIEEKLKTFASCRTCSSGHEAIEVLKNNAFDAVITDYIMQGGDGGSLAHFCANNDIPVLVVSSFPETQIRPYLPEGSSFVNKFHAVRGQLLQDTLTELLKLRTIGTISLATPK